MLPLFYSVSNLSLSLSLSLFLAMATCLDPQGRLPVLLPAGRRSELLLLATPCASEQEFQPWRGSPLPRGSFMIGSDAGDRPSLGCGAAIPKSHALPPQIVGRSSASSLAWSAALPKPAAPTRLCPPAVRKFLPIWKFVLFLDSVWCLEVD